jgi:uncharacterized protein YndB with AHSA1/START domain
MKNTEKPIVIEQSFNASVETVWSAITDKDKMREWFFSEIQSFEPSVGFETSFVVHVEERIFKHLWRLTEVTPMKKIVYDWSYEGFPGRGIVSFELIAAKPEKTLLRLTNEIIEDFPDNIPEFRRESCIGGWEYFINNRLKKYLEEN